MAVECSEASTPMHALAVHYSAVYLGGTTCYLTHTLRAVRMSYDNSF